MTIPLTLTNTPAYPVLTPRLHKYNIETMVHKPDTIISIADTNSNIEFVDI